MPYESGMSVVSCGPGSIMKRLRLRNAEAAGANSVAPINVTTCKNGVFFCLHRINSCHLFFWGDILRSLGSGNALSAYGDAAHGLRNPLPFLKTASPIWKADGLGLWHGHLQGAGFV